MKKIISIMVMILLITIINISCNDSASVVSHNLSQQADEFQILRRVVFYNGITGDYILSVEGYCSIEDQGNQLELTVKIGPEQYYKHFLGLSDNVTYFAEQINSANVSTHHYKVIFKPSTIIPIIDIK